MARVESDVASACASRRDQDASTIGSDHTGVTLRKALVPCLRGRGVAVIDLGTDGTDAVDYPDIAAAVARPWRAARPTPAS